MRGAKAGGGARGRDEALRLIDAAARSAFRRRLARRAYLALGLLAAAWGAASLTAALWDYGATAYYAVLLSVAGLAWPILAWPPSGEPFAAMIRAADPGASVESYLSESYRGENEALRAAALATLRTADFSIGERAGAGGEAGSSQALRRRLPTALSALGLALFVAAQGLSLRGGMGYGLGYPDRSALAAARAEGRDAPAGRGTDETPPAEPAVAGEPGEVVAPPRAAGRGEEGSAPLPERRGPGAGGRARSGPGRGRPAPAGGGRSAAGGGGRRGRGRRADGDGRSAGAAGAAGRPRTGGVPGRRRLARS